MEKEQLAQCARSLTGYAPLPRFPVDSLFISHNLPCLALKIDTLSS